MNKTADRPSPDKGEGRFQRRSGVEERFERNIPAITEAEQEKLKASRVLVAGAGGLGGYVIEHLLRVGVGSIVVADDDRFDITNLNRQLLCTENTVGMVKTDGAALRAREINREANIETHFENINENTVRGLIKGCDVVIDALDGFSARRALAHGCLEEGVPEVFGAVFGWEARLAVIRPGSDKKMLNFLVPRNAPRQGKTVLTTTAGLCAALQVSECVKLITGREALADGVVMIADMLSGEFEKLYCM